MYYYMIDLSDHFPCNHSDRSQQNEQYTIKALYWEPIRTHEKNKILSQSTF